MGYLHIENLYKNQIILMFKECYALEKIHGTSANIKWFHKDQRVTFSSGGETHEKFVRLFDVDGLKEKLSNMFPNMDVTIFGEAYGGKQQRMSETYGKELKFIGFEVQVGEFWLNVPKAEKVCIDLDIEFVDYVKVSTDIESLNAERDKDSTQAIRNGCGPGKMREGVVLKPLIELTMNNGERIIVKHKRDEFKETKTPRQVSPEDFAVMTNAKEIADEWVTEMRLEHVLDKLPQGINVESTLLVINAMLEDVYREAKGEIVESKEVTKCISGKTATLFREKLKRDLQENA